MSEYFYKIKFVHILFVVWETGCASPMKGDFFGLSEPESVDCKWIHYGYNCQGRFSDYLEHMSYQTTGGACPFPVHLASVNRQVNFSFVLCTPVRWHCLRWLSILLPGSCYSQKKQLKPQLPMRYFPYETPKKIPLRTRILSRLYGRCCRSIEEFVPTCYWRCQAGVVNRLA